MNSFRLPPSSGIELLEARIAPAGDLMIQNIVFSFGALDPTTGGPSELGSVSFTLKNIHPTQTASTPDGVKTGLHIYFSADDDFDGEAIDQKIGREPDVTFNLGPGESKDYTNVPVALPDLDLPVPKYAAGPYFILVQADSGGWVSESDEGNNVRPAAQQVNYSFEFGNVGARKNVQLLAFDADSTIVFGLTGAGKGALKTDGSLSLPGNFVKLEVTGTDATSVLSTKGSSGDKRVALGTIVANGPLKIANLSAVNLEGNAIFGDVPKIVLGNAGVTTLPVPFAQHEIFINSALPSAVAMDRVRDHHLNAPGGLTSLFATEWIDNINVAAADSDKVTSAFLSSFTVGGSEARGLAGDSEVDLRLDGADAKGLTLGKTTIAGTIRNAFWQVLDSSDSTKGRAADILAAAANGWNLAVQGGSGDVTIKGDLIGGVAMPALKAKYFGKINVSDDLQGDIEVTGVSPEKYAIEKLGADNVQNTDVIARMGGIGKIKVEEWLGGTIDTSWIKTLTTIGNPTGSPGNFTAGLILSGPERVLNTSGKLVIDAPSGVKGSLGKAVIAGMIGASTWDIDSHIGTIEAGSAAAGFNLMGADLGAIDGTKVKTVKIEGDLGGTLHAAQFNRIEVKGNLTADITATNPDPAASLVLFAGRVMGVDLIVAHHLAAADFWDWNGGRIEANTIDLITAAGHKETGVPGDVSNVVIQANGKTTNGTSISSVSVAGSLSNVTVTAPSDGHIFFLSAQSWTGGSVDAGSISVLKQLSAAGVLENVNITLHGAMKGTSLAEFAAQGTVRNSHVVLPAGAGSFIVHGMTGSSVDATGADIQKFWSTTSPDSFFQFSNINARSIRDIIVRNVTASTTGTDYGFAADFVSKYKRYAGNTLLVDLKEPDPVLDAPGEVDRTGDYRLLLS